MKKDHTSNQNELQRLTTNLNALRQIKFRYENKVFQYNMSAEYFKVLLQKISTKKVQFLSFYAEMPDSWVEPYNNDVKEKYAELKKAFKETAEYFTELHTMATDKMREAEISQPTKPTNQNKLTFTDYFLKKPKKADQLKEYLTTLSGKDMACAIFIIDQNGGNINKERKKFINTFKDEITMQGINGYFKDSKNGYELKFSHKDDHNFKRIENQVLKFL